MNYANMQLIVECEIMNNKAIIICNGHSTGIKQPVYHLLQEWPKIMMMSVVYEMNTQILRIV